MIATTPHSTSRRSERPRRCPRTRRRRQALIGRPPRSASLPGLPGPPHGPPASAGPGKRPATSPGHCYRPCYQTNQNHQDRIEETAIVRVRPCPLPRILTSVAIPDLDQDPGLPGFIQSHSDGRHVCPPAESPAASTHQQPVKKAVRKSNTSWEFNLPSWLKSPAGRSSTQAAMNMKKSADVTRPL